MLPPRVSEHNWWWCAWRSKTPQWPHWLSSARLPGSRTSFCALSWQSPHRPGGVQITGQCDWESNRDNLYRQDTGDARGLRLCYANETWLVTLIPMLLPLPVTELGIQPRCYCRVLAERQTLYQGPGFDPSCCSITWGCHKITGREKYYERLSFIDAIWKVGHVIIYFPKLKGGHKTKINLPFKYDWTIWK